MPSKSFDLGFTLSILEGLFLGRVLGQFCVALGHCSFLPPMSLWMSGLLSYPVLLAYQGAILGLMVWIISGIRGKDARWQVPRPKLGLVILYFGWVYAIAMLGRFFVALGSHLLSNSLIPIFFHWCLAAFVLLAAQRLRRGPSESTKTTRSED